MPRKLEMGVLASFLSVFRSPCVMQQMADQAPDQGAAASGAAPDRGAAAYGATARW